MPLLGSDGTYEADIARTMAFRERVNGVASSPTSATTASSLTQMAQAYPGMSPGVAYGLTSSGIRPGPTATAIFQTDIAANVNRAQRRKVRRTRRGLRGSDEFWQEIHDRDEREQQKAKGGLAGKIVGLPGAALNAITPGDSSQIENNSPLDIKPVVRGAAIGLQAGGEILGGAARVAANAQTPPGEPGSPWGQGTNPLDMVTRPFRAVGEQTTAYQAIRTGDTGTGFLPSGRAVRAQAEAARHYSPHLIGNQAWTAGRSFASRVVDPDSLPYDILSNAIDFGLAWKFDPTAVGLTSLSRARKAGRLFANPLQTAEQGTIPFGATLAKPGSFAAEVAEKTGAYRGLKYRLRPKAPEQFWAQGDGLAYLERLAENKSNYLAWKNTDLPVEVVGRVTAANTADEVRDVLLPLSGTTNFLRQTPKARTWHLSTAPSPFENIAGKGFFASDDWDTAARVIDAHMTNSKVSLEKRMEVFDKIVDAQGSPGRYTAIDATMDAISESLVQHGLSPAKAAEWTRINRAEHSDASKFFGAIATDPNAHSPVVLAGDTTLDLGHESLMETEYLRRYIQMPDQREVRRAVSDFASIVDSDVWKIPVSALDAGNQFWKRAVLLRAAYPLRVVGEEQLRVAAHGMTSLTSNPLGYIATLMATPESKLGALIRDSTNPVAQRLTRPIYPRYAVPDDLDDAASWVSDGLYRRFEGILGSDNRFATKDFDLIPFNSRHAGKAMSDEIIRTRGSRMAKAVFEADTPQSYRDWFWDGPGSRFRTEIAQEEKWAGLADNRLLADDYIDAIGTALNRTTNGNPTLIAAFKTGLIDDLPIDSDEGIARLQAIMESGVGPTHIRVNRTITAAGSTDISEGGRHIRNTLNWFFDSVSARPSNYFSRNPTLRQFFWKRHEELFPHLSAVDRERQIARAVDAGLPAHELQRLRVMDTKLRKIVDTLDQVPRGPMYFRGTGAPADEVIRGTGREWWDKQLFVADSTKNAKLYGDTVSEVGFKADAKILRYDSPEFAVIDDAVRQASPKIEWDLGSYRHEEAIAKEAQARGYDAVHFKDQGVVGTVVLNKDALTDVVSFKADLTLKDADTLAKQFSLDETKNLLYDLSTRSRVADAFRLIAPFGEAWREVTTRWAKLIYDNPQLLRRMQQAIGGAQQSGFFRDDEQTGEQVFTYLGSEWLTDKLIGVPIPLKGRVQGLNLVGNGLPGVGAIIQIPGAWIVPDTPDWDWMRGAIFPYGEFDTGNLVNDAANTLLPSWLRQVIPTLGDPDQHRQFGNDVFDMARFLASTGDYDLQGPQAHQEVARLMSDAKSKTKVFNIVRSLAKFTLPTAPSPDWQVVDKSGNLVLLWKVTQEYQKKLQQTDDPTEAFEWLLDRYGPDNFMAAQSKSATRIPAPPSTEEADAWRRAHPSIAKSYPNTYSLFGPAGKETTYDAYTSQFKRGERVALTAEQMVRLSNRRLATIIYREKSDQLTALVDALPDRSKAKSAATSTKAVELRQLRRTLTSDFPGYGDETTPKADTAQLIDELGRALTNRTLARSDAGVALADYLDTRADIIRIFDGLNIAWPSTSAKAAGARATLRSLGERLVGRYPAFAMMWERVLSREVDEDI